MEKLLDNVKMIFAVCIILFSTVSKAETVTIAAASDLRFALDILVEQFKSQQGSTNNSQNIKVIYGSSGKLTTQILAGAPFDIFFSADRRFTETLFKAGKTADSGTHFADGRLVIWSTQHDVRSLSLSELTNPLYERIAIAQPSHAPYGQRAKEALIATGNWLQIKDKIVFGENIAQTAQFANSGAVDIAIIALSLVNKAAENPEISKGTYSLIDKTSHQPLQQTYVLTNDGEQKTTAKEFISFLNSKTAKHILQSYGFELPADGETTPSHDVDELRE